MHPVSAEARRPGEGVGCPGVDWGYRQLSTTVLERRSSQREVSAPNHPAISPTQKGLSFSFSPGGRDLPHSAGQAGPRLATAGLEGQTRFLHETKAALLAMLALHCAHPREQRAQSASGQEAPSSGRCACQCFLLHSPHRGARGPRGASGWLEDRG